MKQIEITVRLNEKMQEAIRKLEMQGFEKIRESEIEMYKEEIEKFTNELKTRKELIKNYKKL